MRRPRGDDGQLLLLTMFFALVLVLLVAVVVDTSAAFLARRSLAGAADGAALAAAQSVDLRAYYAGAGGPDLPLAGVEDVVDAYVRDNLAGTEVVAVDLVDRGTAVTVTLGRHLALPLAFPGYAAGLDVTATATARLPVVSGPTAVTGG
jgi:Flp pilus assembly protein TadG